MTTPTTARPAAVYAPPAAAAPAAASHRVHALDVIRGLVMVLMAVDHVRIFAGVPTGGSTAVFLTRWITHFCAPAFLFLAGTAAFLHGRRLAEREGGSPGALSRWLLVRGLWLVLLELTVLRLSWTFNLDYAHYSLAGVIWVIGWCMVLMAALVRLPAAVVGAFGVLVIAGHNVMDFAPVDPQALPLPWLWQLLYFGFGGEVALGPGGPPLVVLYTIVPWIGVMAAGYGFGAIVRLEPARRRRLCLAIGLGAIALFVLLRLVDAYGDPRPWRAADSPLPAWLAFLNTSKYPASLLFLLMTLGPTVALVPLLERARGRVAEALAVFGRVPLFYYLLHIPLIHLLAVVVSLARYGEVIPWLFTNQPMRAPEAPEGWQWSLLALYAGVAVVVAVLYLPCRWFAGVKQRRREGWVTYL